MTCLSNHLDKLIYAARNANDHGYVHTGQLLEQLATKERARLKLIDSRSPTEIIAVEKYDN